MAIIYSYPGNNNIQPGDAWIGSKTEDNQTVQFSVSSVQSYMQNNLDFGVTSANGASSTFITTSVSPTTGAVVVTSSLSATGTPSISTFLRGDNTWAVPDYYTNADVDTHLNTSVATSGQVLYWTGTDYDWQTAATVDGTGTATYLPVWVDVDTIGDSAFQEITQVDGNVLDIPGGIQSTTKSTYVLFNNSVSPEVRIGISGTTELGVTGGSVEVKNGLSVLGNTGLVGTTKFYSTITDSFDGVGTAGQVLSSTGSAVQWITINSGNVSGTGTTNYLSKWSAASTIADSVVYDDGTNVGIGTSSPTEKLTVVGKLDLDNGQFSTYIGKLAGTTDADTSPLANVGVGYSALTANTLGNKNVAIGFFSMKTSTGSDRNVAVGHSSLSLLETGDDNVGVGFESGKAITTGSSNTAVGSYSMNALQTGNNNTAVGRSALYLAISNQNTAIGKDALRSTTNGGDNTGVGYQSLYLNSTGYQNTAIGVNSIGANDTGYANVSVGFQAGYSTSSGTNTASSTSIFIGAYSKSSTSTDTNSIVIGYDTTGNGSNTATYGNSSITDHIFTAGNVTTSGSVTVANDTDTASAAKVGALRYRADANNSYVEMCMQTGASTYAWHIIDQYTW